jgi:ribosomal protein S18 acetylase RimI-like enzyme
VLRSGCGRFAADASFLAEYGGRPVGVLLASRLSRSNGHICQVSVLPGAQTGGIGSQLMLASLGAFRSSGVGFATLSVTVDHQRAYTLYRRLGFQLHREFAAHAWVRPPARLELPA